MRVFVRGSVVQPILYRATRALHPSTRSLPGYHPGGRVEGAGGYGTLNGNLQLNTLCSCAFPFDAAIRVFCQELIVQRRREQHPSKIGDQ